MYHVYIFSVGLAVNAVLNVMLIPKFGYMAAAYTTLASYILLVSLVAVVSNRLFRIPWEKRRLLLLSTTGVLVIVAGNIVVGLGVAIVVFAKLALVLAMLITWYWFILNSWERAGLQSIVRRVGRRSEVAVGV